MLALALALVLALVLVAALVLGSMLVSAAATALALGWELVLLSRRLEKHSALIQLCSPNRFRSRCDSSREHGCRNSGQLRGSNPSTSRRCQALNRAREEYSSRYRLNIRR